MCTNQIHFKNSPKVDCLEEMIMSRVERMWSKYVKQLTLNME